MKATKLTYVAKKPIENVIFTIRGEKVILDNDLAGVYGVDTRALNRAVKRNCERFPSDFVFQLTREDVTNLMCQIGTSSLHHGGRRKPTFAFTEQGAIMAANVLAFFPDCHPERGEGSLISSGSKTEVLRQAQHDRQQKLSTRLDLHEKAILHLLRQMQNLLNPPAGPEPPRKAIGFQVRERKAKYVPRRANR